MFLAAYKYWKKKSNFVVKIQCSKENITEYPSKYVIIDFFFSYQFFFTKNMRRLPYIVLYSTINHFLKHRTLYVTLPLFYGFSYRLNNFVVLSTNPLSQIILTFTLKWCLCLPILQHSAKNLTEDLSLHKRLSFEKVDNSKACYEINLKKSRI